jgi:hypothetical protein
MLMSSEGLPSARENFSQFLAEDSKKKKSIFRFLNSISANA